MRTSDLKKFIIARESVRVNKENGKPRPWTKDPILDKYRFCNVHREDDYVTRWLRANWYLHLRNDPDIWFAAVVARLFNLPESLYDIMPYVLPWKPEQVRKILHRRKEQGKKNFNAAYIVSTNGVAMDKIDYLVSRVLGPLWAARKHVRPTTEDTLETFYRRLSNFDGIAGFIGGQVIADLKEMEPFKSAKDYHTFAASGPGSRRGLNRVLGFPLNLHLPEKGWRAHLTDLQQAIKPLELHAQDLQNCLCEFDKYERARLGEGTPKQIYKERSHG